MTLHLVAHLSGLVTWRAENNCYLLYYHIVLYYHIALLYLGQAAARQSIGSASVAHLSYSELNASLKSLK